MRWLYWIGNAVRQLWTRKQVEAELDSELQDHFEQEMNEGIRNGLSPEEARFAALRLIGPLSLAKEECRDARGITCFETVARDVRFAFRTLRRIPVFALTAVVTLALGIGANTTVFTFIEDMLLTGPQVKDPGRLATLAWDTGVNMSYPNYVDFRDRNSTFEQIAGERFAPINLSIQPGNNLRVWGYEVTGNYFDVLGVRPRVGRSISVSDDQQRGANPVLVISDHLWQTRFGADPDIVGRKVRVNSFPFTIIGVAPAQFQGTEMIVAADYWVPLSMSGQIEPGSTWTDVRIAQNLWALGRLKAGVPFSQAEADLDDVVRRIAREYPQDVQASVKIHLAPLGLAGKSVRDPIANFSLVLITIAATGLLLACINLAGMLLARASSRQREIGIRLAIGASRFQLLRQLLTEALLLALCGGALGLGLAFLTCGFLTKVHFDFGVPFSAHLRPDFRVMGFAVVVTALTALLFGLAPAVQAVRTEVAPGLRGDGKPHRRRRWTARDLVVSAQVALSMVLVICSLLVVQSLKRAFTLNLGFQPKGRFAMTTDLRMQGYDETRSIRFRHELLERVAALPGIESAGIINSLPLNLAGLEGDFFGRVDRPIAPPADRRVALIYNVSPGYFGTVGTRLLAGRDISAADQKGRPLAAVVNEAVAEDLFPGESPLGQRVRITTDPNDRGYEIVGVVETGKYRFLSDAKQPAIFLPIDQVNAAWTTLVVRTPLAAGPTANLLRQSALAIDPRLTLFQVGSLTEQLSMPFFPARVAAVALSVFGSLSLVLAATGLFALVAFSVARRTRELGVRIALGATPGQILTVVLQRTAIFCAVGVILGIWATLFASRFLSVVLYGIDARDGMTYGAACGIVMLVGTLACWHPAMRAVRVDPALTLREE